MIISRLAASADLARLCLVAGILAAGCAREPLPAPAPPATPPRSALVFVLIDGFRSDYLDRGITPALSALAASGVRSVGMRPAAPSVSAPNHYTLVTGLYPDRHGMVDNTFFDPELGMYGVDEVSRVDPRFWEAATPLWITAQRQGVRSGSTFYGGSDIPIHGTTASVFLPRGRTVSNSARVDQILTWMDLPEAERPGLYLLYFGSVDTAGHLNGPDAAPTNAAIAEADAAIGRLVAGLRERGVDGTTNIVIVADHGMTDISLTRLIRLADLVDVEAVQDTSYGATLGVNPRPGREAEVERALLRPHEHMTCWRKGEIPERLRYGANPRVPAIFCIAEKGYTIATPLAEARYRVRLLGNHGFDPELPEMAALFLAHGPAFKRNATLPVFDSVHVYALLAHVLGIRPEPGDGDLEVLRAALAP